MNVHQVRNESVRHSLKILFTGALLIFLINIYFGFVNALVPAEEWIPRWQRLIHLHGGAVGWITLSSIGIAIWLLTGEREVDAQYEKNTRNLVWAAVLSFAIYVPFFGLAFSRADGLLVTLLPVFGSMAVLVLWWSAILAIGQVRKQQGASTMQLHVTGALIVAALGATVGALLGMERVIGQFLPIAGDDRVAPHAGMMETYLFLVAAAVIEWFTHKDPYQKAGKAGKTQAIVWTFSASLVPFAFFLNIVDQIMPIFMLSLIIGFLIYLVRAGWTAMKQGPFSENVKPWAWFGSIWLILYLGLFLYVISFFIGGKDFTDLPVWFGAVFSHAAFVGTMTSLIFGVISARTRESRNVVAAGEKVALWLTHVGIVAFAVLKLTSDSRLGSIVMGIGILIGVYTMLMRLRASTD